MFWRDVLNKIEYPWKMCHPLCFTVGWLLISNDVAAGGRSQITNSVVVCESYRVFEIKLSNLNI